MPHDPPNSPASHDRLRTGVRQRYARVPEQGAGCCQPASGCCGSSASPVATSRALGYSDAELAAVPDGSNLGLGCGNPTGIASLQPGQTVLDLGSGAGFDAFLAARAVGPAGRVIGVDMTPEMLQAARENQRRSGRDNVEFRLGEIEHLPLADASVDVVLSNCVINLSPEKARVFAEAFRVLKPGGRLAVSDVVALRPLPDDMRQDLDLYAGCVAGAALVEDLRAMLAAAGFEDVQIQPKAELKQVVQDWFPGRGIGDYVASADITATKPA